MTTMTTLRTHRHVAAAVLALAALGAAVPSVRAAWSWARLDASPTASASIPTTIVKRGQVDMDIYATGELRTTKSVLIFAPPAGAQLRLLTLEPTGSRVKAGQILMTFDPSDQENTLAEQRALLREAELEVETNKAGTASQLAQDEVDLLTAKFDVRKAELDVSAKELRSAIDARKNELTLEECRRRLAQQQEDTTSHTKTSQAQLAVSIEKRNRAKLAMEAAQRLIDQMTVRSPIDGVVAVRPNDEGLSFYYSGMTTPEYRAGDTVGSGRQVAEVLDVAKMELLARVAEPDRGRLAMGQHAEVTIDHEPAIVRAAHVVNVGGVRAGMGRWSGPVRLVDISLELDRPLLSARPGLSASIVIHSDPLKDALSLPRQAVFDQDGKPTVFVKTSSGRGAGGGTGAGNFERRAIKIRARTDTLVIVDDLAEGTEVALVDPEQTPGSNGNRSGAGAGAGSPAGIAGAR
jgi:HlyD family secretion protein